jgi:hypothetical protein
MKVGYVYQVMKRGWHTKGWSSEMLVLRGTYKKECAMKQRQDNKARNLTLCQQRDRDLFLERKVNLGNKA